MADPYLGEIRMFAGTYAPEEWGYCDGALLDIAQNTALYSLIGTTYGGNGRTTLGLPNMMNRSPMGWGAGPGLTPRRMGEWGGMSTVILSEVQLPEHTHTLNVGNTKAKEAAPADKAWLGIPYHRSGFGTGPVALFNNPPSTVPMDPNVVTASGGVQDHENRQPCLGILFIISLEGMYPPRPS